MLKFSNNKNHDELCLNGTKLMSLRLKVFVTIWKLLFFTDINVSLINICVTFIYFLLFWVEKFNSFFVSNQVSEIVYLICDHFAEVDFVAINSISYNIKLLGDEIFTNS